MDNKPCINKTLRKATGKQVKLKKKATETSDSLYIVKYKKHMMES